MKTFLLPLLLLSSMHTFANEKGNGGDVIVCPGKVEVLDLFQGRENWDFPVHGAATTDRRSQLLQVTESFREVDPVLGQSYLKRALEIDKELRSLEDKAGSRSSLVKLTSNKLVNIADEGIAEIPAGCGIEQGASQNTAPLQGEVKFVFQKDLWEKMDVLNQTALILHEVIYERMIAVGDTSSRNTRFMNAALHGGQFNDLTSYLSVSKSLEFRNLEFDPAKDARVFGRYGKCHIRPVYIVQAARETMSYYFWFDNLKKPKFAAQQSVALARLTNDYASKGLCD